MTQISGRAKKKIHVIFFMEKSYFSVGITCVLQTVEICFLSSNEVQEPRSNFQIILESTVS